MPTIPHKIHDLIEFGFKANGLPEYNEWWHPTICGALRRSYRLDWRLNECAAATVSNNKDGR